MKFRTVATHKRFKTEATRNVYNDNNGICYIDVASQEIVLKTGFKPVREKGEFFINIVRKQLRM